MSLFLKLIWFDPGYHLNLYIYIFCSVMKRLITLINQLASESATTAALQEQAANANQTAEKYLKENELLKQVSSTHCTFI